MIKHGVSLKGHVQDKDGYLYTVITYTLKLPDGSRKPGWKWEITGLKAAGNIRKAEDLLEERKQTFEFPPEELALINAVSGETANMLFADYMEEWLEEKEHSITSNTITSYRRNVYNVIAPYFRQKGILLKNLKAKDINDFYNSLRKRGLSESTIRSYHANIGTALRRAVRLQIIPSNPVDGVEPPKAQRKTLQTYNEEQLNELIKAVKGQPLELPVLLASFCGLRRSEACGMRWKCIDFEKNLIIVNHSIVWDEKDEIPKWKGTDTLKNKSSYRTLPMCETLKKVLLEHYNKYKENKRLFGNCYNKEWDGYVCVRSDGNLITPGYVSSAFCKFLSKNNLDPIRYHDLRHTCATLMQKNDIDINYIKEYLGHSDIATTANTYSHLDLEAMKKPVDKMSSILKL